MALEKTEAILLKAYNWSESSRTVVFFTREFGRLALIDKGGRRMTSKRGRIIPFARHEVTFYHSGKERDSDGYISDITLVESYPFEHDGTLGRLAYASAASELLSTMLSDREPQISLYDYYVTFLDLVENSPKQAVAPLFLTFFIRLLSFLGYHPSLGYCVGCSREGEELVNGDNNVNFSPERGGMICGACKTVGDYYIQFPAGSHRVLLALQSASLQQARTLPINYRETTRLVEALTKFIRYQADIRSELKSLAFLEKLRNSKTD